MAHPWRPLAVAALILALVLASCGTRVNDDIRRRAVAAALGEGSGGSGGGGLQGGSGSSTGPGGSALGPSIGPSSGPGQAGGGPAASAPPGGNGGATDIGVTANSITLGNVVSLSGPVPGLFEGAANGTLAYLAYINSLGGVYGRKLFLKVGDDQLDCGENQNQHNTLIPKVFAFVGSFSIYDDCGAAVLNKHRNVPDVAYALSPQAYHLPNNFSPYPLVPGYPTGMFKYWTGKFGDKTKHVGAMFGDVPAARASWTGIKAAAESAGWKFTYNQPYQATQQDFTADVVRMRSQSGANRVDMVFLVATDVATTARIKNAMDSQSFNVPFISPVAYDQSFIDRLDNKEKGAEGVLGSGIYTLFFSAADAQRIPEVALYQKWMTRTNPGKYKDLFSVFGWGAATLFVQALKAAGPKATRASLLAELRKVHHFDGNGILAPSDPAGKTSSNCYVLWRIHNGVYERVDSPADHFRCDATYYRYGG